MQEQSTHKHPTQDQRRKWKQKIEPQTRGQGHKRLRQGQRQKQVWRVAIQKRRQGPCKACAAGRLLSRALGAVFLLRSAFSCEARTGGGDGEWGGREEEEDAILGVPPLGGRTVVEDGGGDSCRVDDWFSRVEDEARLEGIAQSLGLGGRDGAHPSVHLSMIPPSARVNAFYRDYLAAFQPVDMGEGTGRGGEEGGRGKRGGHGGGGDTLEDDHDDRGPGGGHPALLPPPRCRRATLFVAILSHPDALDRRQAIRGTWLSAEVKAMHEGRFGVVEHRFVLGLVQGAGDGKHWKDEEEDEDGFDSGGVGERQREGGARKHSKKRTRTRGGVSAAVRQEAAEFGDVVVLQTAEGYRNIYNKALGGLLHGLEQCEAAPTYLIRANDDVYLDWATWLGKVTPYPPVNVYSGMMVSGVRVLRPWMYMKQEAEEEGGHTIPSSSSSSSSSSSGGSTATTDSTESIPEKSSAVDIATWPSDVYPSPLAQGNAILLSRDLALRVTGLTRKPWVHPLADDLQIGLVAHALATTAIHTPASWSMDGARVECNAEAALHFDLSGVDVMYALHDNYLRRQQQQQQQQQQQYTGDERGLEEAGEPLPRPKVPGVGGAEEGGPTIGMCEGLTGWGG